MQTLSRDIRGELERVVKAARRAGEQGASKALEQLGVSNEKPWFGTTEEQKRLRVRLRAHGRQLGDKLDARGKQSIVHLAQAFRLADAAGLLRDPDLAVARMRALLAVHGIG